MPKQLIFVALNEFNVQLLNEAADLFALPHLKQALTLLHQRKTVTSDVYDSGYLEPWVQWVSIHTGTPSTEHKIKHLGDVKSNTKEQLWEQLNRNGISSGIWGAMNATRGSADHCSFFLPDPWTFDEKAFPREINAFLGLPRYMARNYLNPKIHVLFGLLLKFAVFMCRPRAVIAFIKALPYFLWYAVKYKAANFVTYSFAEYLSTIRFLDYWKRDKPSFSLVFLNLVAHAQHYYWTDVPLAQNDKLKYTFTFLDKILGVLFATVGKDADILIANGLTQINTNSEAPWIMYRQNDHLSFLNKIGIVPLRVEACMTHDAHLFFRDQADRDKALAILQSVKVGPKKFFYLEEYPAEPLKLFYMLEFTDPSDALTEITWAGGSIKMLDWFTPIIRRTAKHLGTGIALSTSDMLPDLPFPNHGIHDVILRFFGISRSEAS